MTELAATTSKSPRVWTWYAIYCTLMALLYLLVVIGGIFLLRMVPTMVSAEEALAMRVQAIIAIGLGLVLFVPFALAPFLPNRSWVWIYGIVMIGIGMTSVCCLPATIPLLIFWIKPETRGFFGRN